MDDGTEPIADEELLYRRVPVSTGWYDPATDSLKPEAFAPHKVNDAEENAMRIRLALLSAATWATCALYSIPACPGGERVLDAKLHHLRIGDVREWTEFPEKAEAASLVLKFQAEANGGEWTLRMRQQDIKQTWRVLLNKTQIGQLHRDENDMVVYYPVPAGAVVDGDNTLEITQVGEKADDVRVGEIALDDRPMSDVLAAATVAVEVVDADTGKPSPCRITILNSDGALQSVGAVSNSEMAVRPGVIYCGHGRAEFGLPPGEYTIYAGRGFEYGIDSVKLSIKPKCQGSGASNFNFAEDRLASRGSSAPSAVRSNRSLASAKLKFEAPDPLPIHRHTLKIRREVPTAGFVSCDTHVHTLTHSGHGDATIEERMLTLAAEGIELPIATDHNKHIDFDPVARRLGVRQYFTPVVGNEVTTKIGHFNIFPVEAAAPAPDHQLADWEAIFGSIYKTPGVKVVILNHARDIHSGYRPFGPRHHNPVTGANLDGWTLRANAMELINSGAQQTDVMRLYHDWFGLLNRGLRLTPVGSSDSHDVARHFVGQARTYIRCPDDDPGNIDTAAAVESFLRGRVMVSLGLLAEITVNGRYGPGDLVPISGDVEVAVRVLGPAWTTAERVELYVNGRKARETAVEKADGAKPGVKWAGTWTLSDLNHDAHLVAIARGPGVAALYWPIAKPYQPTSPHWEPSVLGSTGAVWLDADGDGQPTSAYDYAKRIVTDANSQLPAVVAALKNYDEAVAAQAAGLLQENGVSLLERINDPALKAAPAVTRGFRAFLEAWKETQTARLGAIK